MRTLTVASNTSAVPDTVTGLPTCAPMSGLRTVIAGRYPLYIARLCGLCTGTPPITVLAWPLMENRTPVTVGNCVSVYTTCPIRSGIAEGLAADSNDELRSAVAIPAEMRRPRSVVPAGICVRTPAAFSAAEGPVSRRSSAPRPTPAVTGTVRCVTKSLPSRLNQACTPTSRAGAWLGVAVGRWPLGEAVAVAVPLAGVEAGLDAPAVVVGAGPSEPDEGAPQPTASKLTPTIIIMGRRFMGPPS